jgi:hypothetical protein
MIPWWAASVVANIAIAVVEYFNHTAGAEMAWWSLLLRRTGVPIIVAQWALFEAWRGNPHMLSAWAIFTMGNAVMRMISVRLFLDGEVGDWGWTTLGASCMVAGTLMIKMGAK